jgi:hypothetical protein
MLHYKYKFLMFLKDMSKYQHSCHNDHNNNLLLQKEQIRLIRQIRQI